MGAWCGLETRKETIGLFDGNGVVCAHTPRARAHTHTHTREQVECSATELSQKFCHRHLVDSYPTLKLMGSNFTQPIEFNRDRSVQVSFKARSLGLGSRV